jgi:prefoldin subunit 1
MEMQSNILTSSKKLSLANSSLSQNQKTIRLSELTLAELKALDPQSTVYRSVGKMFLVEKLPVIMSELEDKSKDALAQVKVLQSAISKYDKELKDSQKSLQELFKKVSIESS